ncbi:MAG: hypothetical protein EA419_09880 [Wenzhouxiangella sp.]|nr:MAG: hypothetical protein EA419_09880 [Wenzhouxiangella sp.]
MYSSLTAHWPGRLARLTNVVLVLVLAWLAVQLLWLVLIGPEVEPAAVPSVPQVQPAATARDGFRWDLFGEAAPAAPVVARPVPTSSTRLRLLGLMSGGPEAFAIIADDEGRERVYRSGDELPDGSTLDSIEPFQVVILRNGELEALPIPRERAERSERAQARAGTSSRAQLPGVRGFEAPAGISAAALQTPGQTSGGLDERVSVMPVAGGGFRVRPGRDATLFAELGLQVNDIVTAVNGQPLTSEEDARALFAEVMRRGEVSITITREGREMTLRPDLERILSRL